MELKLMVVILTSVLHRALPLVTLQQPITMRATHEGVVQLDQLAVHALEGLHSPFLRIRSETNATSEAPLFFTLRGERRQFTWQLPHGSSVNAVSKFSKTICAKDERFTLFVTTRSLTPIAYRVAPVGFTHKNVSAGVAETAIIEHQETYVSNFYIPMDLHWVRLTLTSRSESLANVSIVPSTCEHKEGDVLAVRHGIYQTMTTKASFIISRKKLSSFDLVIRFGSGNSKIPESLASKTVTFIVESDTIRWTRALLLFTIIAAGVGLGIMGLFWFPSAQRLLRYPKEDAADFKLLRRLSSRRIVVSGSFVYNLLIIAAFYMLPAIQLLFTYYENYHNSGDEDKCYYNFLCANPWGPFPAFNNIYSNAAYVLFGVIFLLIVRRHSSKMNWRFAEVFYAMGVALILEGFLSAGYHICPTGHNFQFDTTFMYLIAGLCMYHLYQMRNPRAQEHPYEFYGIFAAAVAFVVICISTSRNWQWRVILAALYAIYAFTVCRVTTNTMYHANQAARHHPRSRWWMGTAQAWITSGFIVYSTWQILSNPAQFPSVLLNLFITNLFLFTAFYFIIKVLNGEVIVLAPKICAVATSVSWAVSLYFFNIRVTDWQLSPAASRALNHPCIFLEFFDSHDVWHLLSAFSLFTSFLLLLTLDDGQDMAEFDAGLSTGSSFELDTEIMDDMTALQNYRNKKSPKFKDF